MTIYSWNVNGIRAAIKKDFFKWVNEAKPDVLCIQETKISPDQLTEQMKNPDGYKTFWNSAERKGYSGTANFYRQEILSNQLGFGNERFDNEGRVIETEYEKFFLYNVYFPNGQMNDERLQYKLDFYNEFLKYTLEKKEKAKKEIIITGDFNTAHTEIDLKNPKANEKYSGFLKIEREWIDKYLSKGYIDIFRKLHPGEEGLYTWWTYRFGARGNNVGWRIDYFLITGGLEKNVVSAKIHSNVMGSDHCPISLEIDI